MVTRAVEEPKTLLYWVYHPYTQNPVEKKLINLDIKERINFPEGHLVQKGSEMRGDFFSFELGKKGDMSANSLGLMGFWTPPLLPTPKFTQPPFPLIRFWVTPSSFSEDVKMYSIFE